MTNRILLAAVLLLAPAWVGTLHAHDASERAAPTAPPAAQAVAPATAPAPTPDASASGQANSSPAPESPVAADAAHANASAEHEGENVMLHPGLPNPWIATAALAILAISLWSLFAKLPTQAPGRTANLATLPGIGALVRYVNRNPYPLLGIKLISVGVFLLVIYAGFFGTSYPERNLATTFVWNLWWPLVVVSVLFLGTAWCAICPWDNLANWIVRRRLWRRVMPHPGLNLKVPRYLQHVWIALLLFIGLAWLEVGVGVTSKPFATAVMAVVMLVLSVAYLLVFERKAFCRYACPVGRTLGYYARLAPVAVRPVHQDICATCKTLECYNGSKDIEPCPTHLVVGRFSQNTSCLSCGNCMQSCPHQNVSWRLRTLGSEAIDKDQARPHWDASWFMLALLGITTFHGLTMMPFWGEWVLVIARTLGETGKSLISFTLGMFGSFAFPVAVYASAVGMTYLVDRGKSPYRALFATFAFASLPLAFVYHLAHNLDHLSRESVNVVGMLLNPLGAGLSPLSPSQRHDQMMDPLFPDELMFSMQAGLMVLGFWLAVQIIRHRARDQLAGGTALRGWRLLPMLLFVVAITAMNMWLMAQDMEMRF